MGYKAQILADSIGPHGNRLTTFEVTFPRMVLADMTRHRMLSYSFESTRAVPPYRRIEQIRNEMVVPTFMERAKGMGGGVPLSDDDQAWAQGHWMNEGYDIADYVESMLWLSKEHIGRALEPWTWITGIVTATEWENYFALRSPPAGEVPDPRFPAQYELQVISYMMESLYRELKPQKLKPGQWHLPLVTKEEKQGIYPLILPHPLAQVSAGRCAAVSYLNHHRNETIQDSWTRWKDRLVASAHWSPGEHPAECIEDDVQIGTLKGFKQLRKFYPGEAIRNRSIQS